MNLMIEYDSSFVLMGKLRKSTTLGLTLRATALQSTARDTRVSSHYSRLSELNVLELQPSENPQLFPLEERKHFF